MNEVAIVVSCSLLKPTPWRIISPFPVANIKVPT